MICTLDMAEQEHMPFACLTHWFCCNPQGSCARIHSVELWPVDGLQYCKQHPEKHSWICNLLHIPCPELWYFLSGVICPISAEGFGSDDTPPYYTPLGPVVLLSTDRPEVLRPTAFSVDWLQNCKHFHFAMQWSQSVDVAQF